MEKYIEWLKGYFSKKNELPENVEEINYFEAGLIDSLDAIELIEAIEDKFDIRFNENDFQDRRFAFIKGLAEIINEIKGERNGQ